MKTIHANNYEFHYIEEGKGNPVIFIHGSISDYRTWENQLPVFSKKNHVISYSRRYHFPNQEPGANSDYSLIQHVDDLASIIHSLNLKNVNLIGSSYGAYIGLLTAIKHPDLIKTLVLGEPPIISLIIKNPDNPLHVSSLFIRDFATGKSFLKFGMTAMKPAQKEFKKGNMKEGVRLFANGVLGDGGYGKLPKDVKVAIMENSKALKAELLGEGFPEFNKKAAVNLSVPTLLLKGEKSQRFFGGITDKLLELLPKKDLIVIPESGHDIHSDNPEVYNKTVLEFLLKNKISEKAGSVN